MHLLGEDEYGVWLASPPGTVLQRGEEPPTRENDGFVMLVPRDQWWIGIWNVERGPEIYVDLTTVPQWSDTTVTAVDLDLDVVRHRDGTVKLLDALGQRSEPFGSDAGRWLRALSSVV